MSVSRDRLETAMIAAEHVARQMLLAHEIDVTSLVLTVGFDSDGADLVAASAIPMPIGRQLAYSLHESAVEAGWTIMNSAAGSP